MVKLAMKKLHLTAIRKLFDKLVVRHAVVLNPAASVKGPKHRVSEGLTPPTSPKAVENMLASMDTSNLVRLRDACIVGVLTWTAARAGAVAGLRRGDLLALRKILDQAHDWIWEQEQVTREEEAKEAA